MRKDGGDVPVEIRGRFIRDQQHIPVGYQAILRDITERRRVEAQIKEEGEVNAALARFGQEMLSLLNTSSTLTVDAAILDRPVICFAYDTVPDEKFAEGRALAYTHSSHFAPLVATGGVKVVHSLEECMQSIGAYLVDPSLDRAGRREIVKKVLGVADGGAGERLAAEVLVMAERHLGKQESRRVAA